MKAKVTLQFLGTKIIQGKKDPNKVYSTASFLDGTESVNILVEGSEIFNEISKLPQLQKCDCELDLTLGRYTSVKLLAFTPCKR